MTYRYVGLLFADRISRREDTVIYRAGFSYKTESLTLRLRDKSNNLAHICSSLQSDNNPRDITLIIPSSIWDLSYNFGAPQAVTKE